MEYNQSLDYFLNETFVRSIEREEKERYQRIVNWAYGEAERWYDFT